MLKRLVGQGLLLAAMGMACAKATVIYDDGLSYSITTRTSDNVRIASGSRVTVRPGGSVTGVNDGQSFYSGAVSLNSGSLDVTGNARIDAGTNTNAIRNITGTVRLGDQSRVTGNVIHDHWRDSRLEMSGRSVLDGDIFAAGFVGLQDQSVVLGNVNYTTTYTLEMLGGVIAGTAHMHGINGDYQLNMHGGAILGGVDAWNSYGMNIQMTGGLIDNGLLVTDWASIDGEISGGQIFGGITIDTGGPYYFGTNDLVISGGQFNADALGYLLIFSDTNAAQRFSSLQILGGQFGYQEQGLGFFVDNLVNFDIYGRDLVFQNGWLTGWLSDGSWFNNALTFGSDYRGQFTIHNVPEPGTYGLLLLSLSGVLFAKRRRVAGGASDS